jgi:hypothetical protein
MSHRTIRNGGSKLQVQRKPAKRRTQKAPIGSGTPTEVVETLLHRAVEALERLRELASSPAMETLRPALGRCVRLHELSLSQLERLRESLSSTAVQLHSSNLVEDDVIVVTDADILP